MAGQWVGLTGQAVWTIAGQVVGTASAGQNVCWTGHCVCWAAVGHTVVVPGVRVGPQVPSAVNGHWVMATGHWVDVGRHSVGVSGVVVGPPQLAPTGHFVCWIGQTVAWTGHLVTAAVPAQVVAWVVIGQVVAWVAQIVIAPVVPLHWVAFAAMVQVVGALEHWVMSTGQVVVLVAGHSVVRFGQEVVTTGHWVVTDGHWVAVLEQTVTVGGHWVGTVG